MISLEAISLVLTSITFFTMVLNLGLGFYIIKTRIKEIDKAIQGYENHYHSILLSTTLIQIADYSRSFISKSFAQRSGMADKIIHFDYNFRRPFIAFFLTFIASMVSLILVIIMETLFLN